MSLMRLTLEDCDFDSSISVSISFSCLYFIKNSTHISLPEDLAFSWLQTVVQRKENGTLEVKEIRISVQDPVISWLTLTYMYFF